MIEENIRQGESTLNMVVVVTSDSEDRIEIEKRITKRSKAMWALNKIVSIMKLN